MNTGISTTKGVTNFLEKNETIPTPCDESTEAIDRSEGRRSEVFGSDSGWMDRFSWYRRRGFNDDFIHLFNKWGEGLNILLQKTDSKESHLDFWGVFYLNFCSNIFFVLRGFLIFLCLGTNLSRCFDFFFGFPDFFGTSPHVFFFIFANFFEKSPLVTCFFGLKKWLAFTLHPISMEVGIFPPCWLVKPIHSSSRASVFHFTMITLPETNIAA